MNGRVVFLLEEPSMKVLLEGLLPRLFPGWLPHQDFLCVAHQGKSDLDLSVPRKLKAWKVPGDRFVIVRDTDGADCVKLKARYLKLVASCGRPNTLVRLVCQELESWYLGDLQALGSCFDNPGVNSPQNRKRYVDPDSWQKPSAEVSRCVPEYQKTSGARSMAQHLDPARNTSHSFHVLLKGVARLAAIQA